MPDIDKLLQTDDRFDKDRINGNETEDVTLDDIKLENLKELDMEKQLDRVFKTQESDMESPVSWKLNIKLIGNKMTITVGNEILADNINISDSINNGGIALECYGDNGEIYDGIYDELNISPITEENKN